MSALRTRWAAVGAAVAVTLGGGGIGLVSATTSSGDRPVFVPIEPCRLAATRPAPDTVGPRTAALGPQETEDFDGWGNVGNCSLPSGTSALALNVTAVGATQQTNLRFFPQGSILPTTANLNPKPGASPTPNAVNVALNDSNGRFSVFNRFGSVAVVIDVMGYYDHHTHDDRYYTKSATDSALAGKADAAAVYTKAAADALFVAQRPGTSYQPHLLDFVPDVGSAWTLATGWQHAAGSVECLAAPVHLAEGSSNLELTMTYQSAGPTTVLVALVSLRTTPGSGAASERLRRHVVDLDVALPNTGGLVGSITISDEPGDAYAGLAATPVPGAGWDTLVSVCTASALSISSVRADAG